MRERFGKKYRIAALILISGMCMLSVWGILVGTVFANTDTYAENNVQVEVPSKVYTMDHQSTNENFEYKLVYKSDLKGLYNTLYFNATFPDIDVLEVSVGTYMCATGEDFKLCIKNGTLWLIIGDKQVVTTEFSVTNDW